MQIVHLAYQLGKDSRLVDDQTGTVHEVHRAFCCDPGVEGEDLVANPSHQPFTVQRVGPVGPAQQVVRNRLRAFIRRVARIAEAPVACESPFVRLSTGPVCGADASRIRRLEHVEEEEEAELLGILGGVGVTAAEEMIADSVDAATELGRQRHGPVVLLRAGAVIG